MMSKEEKKERRKVSGKKYYDTHIEEIKKYREENKEKLKVAKDAWYERNKIELLEESKIHYQENKESIKERVSNYYYDNWDLVKQYRDSIKEEIKEYNKDYNVKHSEQNRERSRNQRLECLYHYSNGTMQCKICSESHYEFLTTDHIHNNGTEHRKQIKGSIYKWLIKNNFPEGYQILCWNCNLTKGFFGESAYIKKYEPDINNKGVKLRLKRKQIVISHYSNNTLTCACCGELNYDFLCMDHVNGGGSMHKINNKIGSIYNWLFLNDFPEGFRVLCYNCNCSLRIWGYCPHKPKEEISIPDLPKYNDVDMNIFVTEK